jgi:hypothetical protein
MPIAMPALAPDERPPADEEAEEVDVAEAGSTPVSVESAESAALAVFDAELSFPVPPLELEAAVVLDPESVVVGASERARVVEGLYIDATPPVLCTVNVGPTRKSATLSGSCSSNAHSIGYSDTVISVSTGSRVYVPLSSSAHQSANVSISRCSSTHSMSRQTILSHQHQPQYT